MVCCSKFYAIPGKGDVKISKETVHGDVSISREELREFVLKLIARTGINPDTYTMGELFLIAKEHNYQKQTDRACSAQSPDMLPKSDKELSDIEEARRRVDEFKEKKQDVQSRHNRRKGGDPSPTPG